MGLKFCPRAVRFWSRKTAAKKVVKDRLEGRSPARLEAQARPGGRAPPRAFPAGQGAPMGSGAWLQYNAAEAAARVVRERECLLLGNGMGAKMVWCRGSCVVGAHASPLSCMISYIHA